MARDLEGIIAETLAVDAAENALDFVRYLRTNEMAFERGQGYWEDKCYWMVKFGGAYLCFILLDGYQEAGQPWVIWLGDGDVAWCENALLDERTKALAWSHVDSCGGCGSCGGGMRQTIFGRQFEHVCRTTFRFDNPGVEEVQCAKKLVELRRSGVLRVS